MNEFYGVMLWMIIFKFLRKWDPIGSLSGSGTMSCYFYIALTVTNVSMSVLHMLAKGVVFISNEVRLRLGGLKCRFGVP